VPTTLTLRAQAAAEAASRPDAWAGWRRRWALRLPLLPALLVTVALTQLPFAMTLYYSLQRWNLLSLRPRRFVGLHNFVAAFNDSTFLHALGNTLLMTGSIVVCSVLAGTLLAVGLNRPFLGRNLLRTLAITPFFIMPVAAALFWKAALFDPSFGLFGWLTASLGLGRINWLSQHPMVSVVMISAWQWSSFVLMIILAGLQSFPEEVEEAALVDGATRAQIFRLLTLPHLRPFLELSALLVAMYALENFAAISQLTAGGPAYATTNLSYYVYLQAFSAFSIGRASAYGAVSLLVALALVTPLLRLVSGILRLEGR